LVPVAPAFGSSVVLCDLDSLPAAAGREQEPVAGARRSVRAAQVGVRLASSRSTGAFLAGGRLIATG